MAMRRWFGGNPDYAKNYGPKKNAARRAKYASMSPDERKQLRQQNNESTRNRIRRDPAYAVKMRLKVLLYQAVRKFGEGKKMSSKQYGISYQSLAASLGPCPGNRKDWHIDHRVPCAAFDHTKQEELSACWHISNLRWLPAKENLAKRDDGWTEEERKALIQLANPQSCHAS